MILIVSFIKNSWPMNPALNIPLDKHNAPLLAGDGAPKRFHAMAKPVGSTCNLDCAYCYYLSKETLPKGPGAGRMSDETLEMFVKQYIDGVTGGEVIFSWQGGEPTLLGVEFFRKVVALQKKHAKPGQWIENDLQTNGTLLNEEWCEFLKAHRFLVGLSIDGPREIHDHYRVTKGGRPTFDKVFAAAKLLQRFGVPFNTLTCVHRFNGRRPVDVYRFLRQELNSTYIQFIPIVEHRTFQRTAPQTWNPAELPRDGEPEARPGHPGSIVTDWSVDPEDWGYFLCRVFDRWLSQDIGKVMVNHFETLVAQHLRLPSQMCIYSEACGKAVAVENDGGVYACDHYVYPEYRLGNLKSERLGRMVFSPAQVRFGSAKSESLPQYCRQCAYLSDCWGECPKNRLIRTPAGELGLNYLCRGFKKFFAHALPDIERIAARLRQEPLHPRPRM
jgi:uncharacterized protein